MSTLRIEIDEFKFKAIKRKYADNMELLSSMFKGFVDSLLDENGYHAEFERLWAYYPNKSGKDYAYEEFMRLGFHKGSVSGLIEDLQQQGERYAICMLNDTKLLPWPTMAGWLEKGLFMDADIDFLRFGWGYPHADKKEKSNVIPFRA